MTLMAISRNGLVVSAIIGIAALALSNAYAEELQRVNVKPVQSAQADRDWPQYCGPNRNGVAVSGPKLLDSWPHEGPPQH
jgi:hypothetical protein